ncbi:MAG: hypothetical protein K0S76_645 [Herbinix sp.]|nr:hypothetical protein [Herbinix sp.]
MKKVISFVLVAVLLMATTITASAFEAVADGYTRYEGENGTIVGSNAPNGLGTDTGEQFSNGSAAGYLDVGRAKFADLDATFSNTAHVELTVTAAASGTADVIVGYTCADDALLVAIQANDGAPVEVPLVPAKGNTAVQLDLKEGENTVYVSTTILDEAGAQHGWVNIDYIDVKSAEAGAVVEDTAAPADETPAEEAAAPAEELPETGDTSVVPLLVAGAACLLVAVVANKKLRKNVLN